jgi:hypothetical protein
MEARPAPFFIYKPHCLRLHDEALAQSPESLRDGNFLLKDKFIRVYA